MSDRTILQQFVPPYAFRVESLGHGSQLDIFRDKGEAILFCRFSYEGALNVVLELTRYAGLVVCR